MHYDFLIGTHRCFFHLKLAGDLTLQDVHVIDQGHTYGICPHPVRNDVWLVSRQRAFWAYHKTDAGMERGDKLGTHGQLQAVHQLAIYGDAVLVADTRHDRLALVDPDSFEIRDSHPLANLAGETVHVNSIFPMGDQCVVLLHNGANPPSQAVLMNLKGGFSEIARVDLQAGSCHNIFCDGHHLLYNASGSRTAHRLALQGSDQNPNQHRDSLIKRFGLHTKGLAVSEAYIFLGVSEFVERKLRSQSVGAIVVLDRKTMDEVARIPLTDPETGASSGNINEIRLINQPDFALSSVTELATPFVLSEGGELIRSD
jgi:hypothetical protein